MSRPGTAPMAKPASVGASVSPTEHQSSTLTDNNFLVPAHLKDNTITRHFSANFSGSLSELADTPSLASWTPTESSIFQSKTRYKPNAQKSDGRQGNLQQAILIGMKLKKVSSTFPCELGLTITGAKGNYYTGNGSRFAYIASANEKGHTVDKIVATTNPYINSEYLRMYPGMTKDNLRKGIMDVPDADYVFVDEKHPIVEMMSENQAVLGIDLSSAQLVDNRWFKVEKTVSERCLAELGEELSNHLPIVDLSNFQVGINRLHGASWDSEAEVCDNVSSVDMRSKIMDGQRRASFVIEMSYSFV